MQGGGRQGCKRERERNQNTALKRKKKNGSPEMETCRVNGMAKEGTKREQEGAQRLCTYDDA